MHVSDESSVRRDRSQLKAFALLLLRTLQYPETVYRVPHGKQSNTVILAAGTRHERMLSPRHPGDRVEGVQTTEEYLPAHASAPADEPVNLERADNSVPAQDLGQVLSIRRMISTLIRYLIV